MESEVRLILTEAVTEREERAGLVGVLADRFSELGGVDLTIPDRSTPVRGADFS
jgi:plasmid stability protein